jgi:hypothetical protein
LFRPIPRIFHKSFTCAPIISFILEKYQKARQSQSRYWTVDVAPVGSVIGKIIVFVDCLIAPEELAEQRLLQEGTD